jgi:hypothetical protein
MDHIIQENKVNKKNYEILVQQLHDLQNENNALKNAKKDTPEIHNHYHHPPLIHPLIHPLDQTTDGSGVHVCLCNESEDKATPDWGRFPYRNPYYSGYSGCPCYPYPIPYLNKTPDMPSHPSVEPVSTGNIVYPMMELDASSNIINPDWRYRPYYPYYPYNPYYPYRPYPLDNSIYNNHLSKKTEDTDTTDEIHPSEITTDWHHPHHHRRWCHHCRHWFDIVKPEPTPPIPIPHPISPSTNLDEKDNIINSMKYFIVGRGRVIVKLKAIIKEKEEIIKSLVGEKEELNEY